MTHLRGVKPTIIQDKAPLTKAPSPPKWLSAHAKAEWKRILPPLIERKILTDADMGTVESYCLAIGRIRQIEQEIATAGDIDPKKHRMQLQTMQTARQLAAELGLTPASRSRPAVRGDGEDNDDIGAIFGNG